MGTLLLWVITIGILFIFGWPFAVGFYFGIAIVKWLFKD